MKKLFGGSKLVASAALISVLLLTGCASGSPTATPTATPTPTPTRIEMTDAQAQKNFKAAVDASMDLADKKGLTQTSVNDKWGDYVLVLDRNYNPDYSAAVKNADGTVEIIFEAYAFAPWGAWEALDVYQAKVTWDADTNHYVIKQNIEGVDFESRYTVADGVIVEERGSSKDSSWVSTLVYAVDADGHAILDEALATLEQ